MRAVSSVARSEVAGLAKAARAVKVRVGTLVGASVRVLSGSCSNVTLGGAAGRGWDEAGTLCVIGGERCVGAPSAGSHSQDLYGGSTYALPCGVVVVGLVALVRA